MILKLYFSSLMADMEKSVINVKDFDMLKKLILLNGVLVENWNKIISQYTANGRSLIAKQAMELIQIIDQQCPFEKLEFACFIYEQMINKESFQMVINCFHDKIERENLIHRLGIKKKFQSINSDSINNFTL